MTPQIMRILKKLYRYDNRYYNEQDEPSYDETILSDKERDLLRRSGWLANDIVHFDGHADIIAKLHSLKDEPLLAKQRCLDAFVAGIGGSYRRGLSALPAWYLMAHCPKHTYDEKPQYACCWTCSGKDEQVTINNAEFQYCLYLGNAYSSGPMYAYLNLQHLLTAPVAKPTKDDIITLSALLDLIRRAPSDETPGKFEKRLAEAKIMKGDKYTKRGVLNSLAIVGVIPNQFIPLSDTYWTSWGTIADYDKQLSNTKGRSDMEMPWAGWTGALKLNEQRVQELFAPYWDVFI